MSEQLEFNFEKKPQCWTSCAECDEPVHAKDVVIKQSYNGSVTTVEHFCSDLCYHYWYINRLRGFGL